MKQKKKKAKLQDHLGEIVPNQLGNRKEETLTLLGELPYNRIKENEIEKKKELEREPNKIIVKLENNNQRVPFYTPIEIQNAIETYHSQSSNYFIGDNKNLVINTYTDYYNNFHNTKLSISKFEQVLYFHLMHMTMSLNAKELNVFISTHPITVQSADIHNTIKLINEDTNAQDCFKKEIEEQNFINSDNQ